MLGHPVAHSRSPAIHGAAFAAAGVDAVYLAFDVVPDQLPTAVAGLAALGALGVNVTIPHKTAALSLADVVTEEARLVGAANTLWWTNGALHADNTDARGLEVVLRRDVGLPSGARVVVVGAGGAARAAAVALGRVGAAVSVVARRPDEAAAVAALAREAGGTAATAGTPVLVVNATPLGWRDEPLGTDLLPPALRPRRPDHVALDLVYGRGTPFLAEARAAGARAIDGLAMLVEQAALAFERWTGLPAPRDVMTTAARRT